MSQELRANIFDYFNIPILIAILAFSPWFYGSVGLVHRYFIHLASLAVLLVWLIKKNISSKEITYYPSCSPLIAFFIISILSILFSVNRYASVLETLNLFSYLIIFFLVIDTVNSQKRLNLFIWLVILTGVFYCSYGILQYKGFLPKDFWTQPNSLSSRFVNSGSFGAFININIFLSLGAIFYYKKILARITFILFFVIFLIALILSNSRISWLVFLFILPLFAILLLRKPIQINTKRLIFIIIFGIIILYIFYQFKPLIWQRTYVAAATQFQSLYQRIDIWKGTLRLILHHPFGTGIGTFQYIYPAYRVHSDRFFVDFAHSDFLQIAGELGVIGLALFVWFILRLFRSILKALFELPHREVFLVLGLGCAGLSFIFQAILDFPIHIPANALLFFVTIALLVRYTFYDKAKPVLVNRYTTIGIIVTIIISAILFTNIYFSEKHYRLAEKYVSNFEWKEALSNYDRAIKLMPMNAESFAGKGSIYALKTILSFGPQKKDYQQLAKLNFIKAIKLNSCKSDYYLNLARLYVDSDDQTQAMAAFKKAIETNPTNNAFYFPYADYCLERCFLSEASKTYKKALSLFMTDDWRLRRLYGIYGRQGVRGIFDKIYNCTRDYRKLEQAVPDTLDMHLAIASFLESKGRLIESCREYKEILAKYPTSQEAKEALNRLTKEIPFQSH